MIYLELFYAFLKIGAFTFGGGYAMITLIQSVIISQNWMTISELINFIAVAESTPGPIGVNLATYCGITLGGLPGALLATLGVILPSFVIIIIVAHYFEKFKSSKVVKGIMTGLKPAVIGMISSSLVSVGTSVFFDNIAFLDAFKTTDFYISFTIFITMTILAFKKVHPIYIICISALTGIICGFVF